MQGLCKLIEELQFVMKTFDKVVAKNGDKPALYQKLVKPVSLMELKRFSYTLHSFILFALIDEIILSR